MLTKTIMVRKLVPVDQVAFDKDPASYTGEWKSDPDGDHGEAISENFLPLALGEGGEVRMLPMLGVVWEKKRNPAISYEDPAFLENINHLYEEDEDEKDEGEEEETD